MIFPGSHGHIYIGKAKRAKARSLVARPTGLVWPEIVLLNLLSLKIVAS